MVQQIRFLGSSLRGVNSNLGLGRDSSQVTLELVDDVRFGDAFNPPVIGSPVSFSIGSFTFNGITQNYETTRGRDGNPLHTVILTDPREVLAGAFVITGGYSGSVSGVPNVYNAYGYFEQTAFGAAKSNSAGMSWNQIKSALSVLTNTTSAYGTYLNLKGYNYQLDLSDVPNAPVYYRLGGNFGIGLLDAIDQVCRDGGCDYYVTLEQPNNVIKVNVISRVTQPPLGTISSFVNSRTGDVINSRSGLELRNDVTSAFVVGEHKHDIFLASTINCFYGFDIDGIPLSTNIELFNERGQFDLNSASISDITGSTRYQTTHLELRLALENELMWKSYIAKNNSFIKDLLQINGDIDFKRVEAKINAKEQLKRAKPDVDPNDVFNNDLLSKNTRVYDFVRTQAATYYGKQFIVRIPDLQAYTEDESNIIRTSLEVADSGWNETVVAQVNLTEDQADLLKDDTNRMRAFSKYNDASSTQWQLINPQNTVLTNDSNGLPLSLFTKAEVEKKILFLADGNYVIVRLPEPILERLTNDRNPDYESAAKAFVNREDFDIEAEYDQKVSQIADAFIRISKSSYFTGDVNIGIYNRAVKPDLVAIPLKDNTQVYGPWHAVGPGGKTEVRQSGEFAPWNYNGETLLETAARASVYGGRTTMQESESGTITLVGEPVASLGGVLSTNGPNLTNINISYDAKGNISCSYIFRSFTKTFGNTSQISRIIQNQGNLQTRNRRLVNEQVRSSKARANIEFDAGLARTINTAKGNLPKRWRGQTPHECIMAGILDDLDDVVNVIPGAVFATFEEIRDSISKHTDDNVNYQKTAVMSLTGVLRPFSTRYNDQYIACYTQPSGTFDICQSGLNPLQSGHDIAHVAFGDSNEGQDAQYDEDNPYDPSNARGVGLRGPIIVTGWGRDILTGRRVGELKQSDSWKTGPVDLMWDELRGVWTSFGKMFGRADAEITPGLSGYMTILMHGQPSTHKLFVYHPWSSGNIAANTKISVDYYAYDNKWYITSADC